MLIVDDDPGWRSLYRLEFGDRFEIVEAVDGRDGLDRLEQARPDLVILDLRMPGMDGVWFLACLEDRGNRTPVIVCTAVEREAPAVVRSRARIVPKSPDLTRLREAIAAVTTAGR